MHANAPARDLLLVEDDGRLAELVALALGRRGFRVRTAASFGEARRWLREEPPELLLSDVMLGGEDGRRELPALWAEGLLPPTLVVSGYLDAAIVRELGSLPPVVGTLTKPYDLDVLEARIREALAALPERGRRDPLPHDGEREDGWIEIRPAAPHRGAP